MFFVILAFLFKVNSFAFTLEEVKADLEENMEEGSVIGLGVMYPIRPYKGVDNDIYAAPIASLEYKRFFIDGASFGFNLIDKEAFKFSVLGAPRFWGYEADDSPDLTGMQERQWSFDGGLRVLLKGKVFAFSTTGLSDLLDEHQGQEVNVMFSAKILQEFLKLRIGVAWLSNDLIDYYYGVRSSEATATRSEYAPSSTVNYLAGLTIGIPVREHWAVVADLQYEFLGDEIKDSPIIDKNGVARYILGMVYRF
jgi:outer membrane protein